MAHSLVAEGRRIRKGERLGPDDCACLSRSQIERVTIARLEPGDLGEDEAACRIALAGRGRGVKVTRASRGRCDLVALWDGLAVLDDSAIHDVNARSESIAVSTRMPFERVVAGQKVATCKVVPYALAAQSVGEACRIFEAADGAISVAPFRPRRVALLQTILPGIKGRTLAKTVANTDLRVRDLGGCLVAECGIAHEIDRIAEALQGLAREGAEIILVVGASAITDRDDDIPRAIVRIGGRIVRLGMPVDPGNLTLVAWLNGVHVLGFPGSFRSTCLHGCDWLLQRIFAGLPVDGPTIARMGVGGLLK